MRRRFLVLLPAFSFAVPASALQSAPAPADTAGAYVDAAAARLVARARAARARTDHSIRSYTAVLRSRFAAALRMPLKDRSLFRFESAARARWSRDAGTVVQVLAAREQHPGGIEIPDNPSGLGIDELFDPGRDRMYFGIGLGDSEDDDRGDDDDFWIEHPIGDDAERHYRFQSGDTLTLRLQDGRTLRTVELIITPRRDDPHTVRGVVWLEAESGSLVQAAFRLARTVDILRDMPGEIEPDDANNIPGFMKPIEFDISLITVDYSLFEMAHWLPRSMRVEGMARAGAFRVPAAMEVSYEMEELLVDGPDSIPESVLADSVRRAWAGTDYKQHDHRHGTEQIAVLVPRDSMRLIDPAVLPPAIWQDAPGFITDNELKQLQDRIEEVARAQGIGPRPPLDVHFGWGFGEPDMLRYNRVEALSVGARAAVEPMPGLEAAATVRFGIGDLHPNAALLLRRATPRRTLELRGYHELASVDGSGHALGLGNSVSSFVLGRDEGEYYRASGAMLTVLPAWDDRRSWELSLYAEDHDDVERNTHISLPRAWSDSVFRSNITADEAQQYGAMLRLQPWWGSEPMRPQFGLDVMLQAETGDYEHARGRVTLRAAAPLVRGARVGLEAGVGTSTGDVPVQRMFFLGGASTLRGYDASTVSGTSMARARLELARAYPFANLAVFSDWGWAGDRPSTLDEVRNEDQRLSVGIGASLLDGLVRLDLAHGLREPRGWRLDLHLDAIL